MSQLVPERGGGYAPQRRNPFSELGRASERMRQMLEQTFAGFIPEAGAWAPAVDIEEQDNAYVIEADAPGVKREDIDIEVTGRELVITGEIKERDHQGVVRRRTRRVGRFEYRVMLPDDVDQTKVEAKLNDGVLTVTVPKAEPAERRKIEVSS